MSVENASSASYLTALNAAEAEQNKKFKVQNSKLKVIEEVDEQALDRFNEANRKLDILNSDEVTETSE